VDDFYIDNVDAGLRLTVTTIGVPRTGLDGHIDQVVHRDAPPLTLWREAAAAFATKLEEERLPTSVLRPDGMGTHFPVSPLIASSNLALVQNRLFYE
jgi:hypothetical protein